jgi:hypothetical protein
MDVFLGVLGMLACIAIMAALMPLGMRVVRRVRDATARQAPNRSRSHPQDPSPTRDPSQGDDQATRTDDSPQERG